MANQISVPPPTLVDIAIIGAGAAGLQAANLCQQQGRSVVVIEGRDRVGGRLLSIPVPGADEARLDLGATWFWSNEPLVNKLISDHKLSSFQQHLAGDTMFQGPPADDGRSGAERIPGNQIDAPSARLTAGTQSIADALAAQLADGVVQFNQTVTSIAADETSSATSRLIVSSPDRRWAAQQLIVALPPATAVSAIDFHGLLPTDLEALAARTPVWMGNIVKAVAHYDTPFWREAGLAGAAFSYTGPLREIHDMSGEAGTPSALFGFAQPGPGNPAPTRDAVVGQLIDLFGPAAASPISLTIHDWRQESFTSPPNVDALSDFSTYGNPLFSQPCLNNRGHWASTETATTAPGHIEGALQAGTRAANNALRLLDA